MRTEADIQLAIATVGSGRICPIFSISSCSGEGIDLLRKFLSIIPISNVREQSRTNI